MTILHKLLIANRGEIACRIIRTARKMGLTTVAVYSDADAQSLHVQQADEAYCLGPALARDSYLNIDAVIRVAQHCGADALHPGYGFLSENPVLAQACLDAGITFIGPSVAAMQIMGSKQLAKQALASTQVPLIPGYHGDDQSDDFLLEQAHLIGFPLLIKAANGGGGKGLRTVLHSDAFMESLVSARREARACFGNDIVLLEKLIQQPRHIEIQIMADHFGHVVAIFERDCSIQRRHQKVIEEAPADHLPMALRESLANAAITIAKTIDYLGAGTVECLVDNQGQFYFMEMNTRLQVEHPVTEMITGLDLVEWQIRIAAHQPLPLKQSELRVHGHAIECRLYAEDPQHDFLPSTGSVRFLRFPTEEYIRIDTAIQQTSLISQYYDPMIAKIIAWGEHREEARQRLVHTLKQCHVGGIQTNLGFLLSLLQNPNFVDNTLNTEFLNQYTYAPPAAELSGLIKAAVAIQYANIAAPTDPLYKATFAWQMHLPAQWCWRYHCQGQTFILNITPLTPQQCHITSTDAEFNDNTLNYINGTQDCIRFNDATQFYQYDFECIQQTIIVYSQHGPIEIQCVALASHALQSHQPAQLTAPMPGIIVAILKQRGDTVAPGDGLLVIEAMKMEHTIRAPHAGFVQDIFYPVGAQVQEGVTLAAVESL